MDVKALYDIFFDSEGVAIDSRADVSGKLFFALSGENFDGNRFAAQALEKGAVKAVIDKAEFKKDDRYVLVNNTLEMLQQLAAYHRGKFSIPFIGITGTNGKTTTKELVSAVLSVHYKTVATQGNLNNHIGVPLTLLRIKKDTEIAVIEMGANHPGEIAFLCELSKPTHGIITNIGKAHLEGFGSFEGVKKTKNELYEFLRQNHGVAFVHFDDPLLKELSEGLVRYGYCAEGCYVSGKPLAYFPFLKIALQLEQTPVTVQTHLYGAYNVPNLLAAATVGKYFKVPADKIKRALEDYQPANNRSQVKKTASNTLILDAYNANPVSLSKAIESFYEANFDNPCLILGDMFELGDYSLQEHQKIVELLKARGFDCVFLVGKDFVKTDHPFMAFKTTEDALNYLKDNPLINKTVLLKGSRGMHLETLLEVL